MARFLTRWIIHRIQAVLLSLSIFFLAGAFAPAFAHFQMIIPSDEIVSSAKKRKIGLELVFTHPFLQIALNLQRPKAFGVWVAGKTTDLLGTLEENSSQDRVGETISSFKTQYKIKKPGDHIFFVQPQPYWEETESVFIVHYTKTVVNAFGVEEGWDRELGLKAEIIPLTRPYGLWVGNVFQGIVKLNGQTAPFATVEVEYYNKKGEVTAPSDPFITQVVKTDANGVFTYVMPRAGWWGFAALLDDGETMQHKGKAYPVESGAVLWVKTKAMQ